MEEENLLGSIESYEFCYWPKRKWKFLNRRQNNLAHYVNFFTSISTILFAESPSP